MKILTNICLHWLLLVIVNSFRWFLLFISILYNDKFQSRTILNSHGWTYSIISDQTRIDIFRFQPCQPPVRFLTAIYNALSLYFKRKNAYGCRLISSTINLSAISHVYRYTSRVFRNSIHFSWSSIQRLSQRFLIFLIFPFVLFVLFIDYNRKLLKNLRSRNENFEKKIRYDIAILENFTFGQTPETRDTTVQIFSMQPISNFASFVHSLANCLKDRSNLALTLTL